MEYQRKQFPFLHGGMSWNQPPEKIPPGKIPWCKNARVLQQGTITSANGHTQFATIANAHYIHTISRLNINNDNYDGNLTPTFVVGADQDLYAFQNPATPGTQPPSLTDPALNPVRTPGALPFSGMPLTMVDASPAGAVAAWKYVGDTAQMCSVGYYPGDAYLTTMARCLPIGLPPPLNFMAETITYTDVTGTITTPPATGLIGNYSWIFAYRRVPTGARSNPSAAGRPSASSTFFSLGTAATSTTPQVNQIPTFLLPITPVDPQTNQPDTHIVVDIYRFGGAVFRWALVGSGPGGSSFTDSIPDEQLLAAPSPPTATDATTGLQRFNLYQPFVTQDVQHSGTVTVYKNTATPPNVGSNTWLIDVVSGPYFNMNWLPGSTITIGNLSFTIYQVLAPFRIELTEDLTGIVTSGNTFAWEVPAGTLQAGQPLNHLWGVYGVGNQGSYLFGCGDPNNLSVLYWTNGNDPDSTDVVNNIVVTSPSEKVQTGCIYAGQAYCWSTERQFQIFPSLTAFGQFTTQEMAGAKGCFLEWSLSVQSNELADLSVSWRGKDGIYDWSVTNGLRRLSDELYAFFPHDNQLALAPETILPYIGSESNEPEIVGNLDDTQPQYHRLTWFQGMLFYDFVAQTFAYGNTYSTLVWDDVQVKGWVSLDQPFGGVPAVLVNPISRGIEIGTNNLKVSWGFYIYDYFGYTRGFQTRVVTPAEDLGDSRSPKLWGDYWFDSTPFDAQFTIYPLGGFNLVDAATPNTLPSSGISQNFPLDFLDFVAPSVGGKGWLTNTMGLDIRWVANDGPFAAVINQWTPSFILKPDYIQFRFTDRDDQGALQAKYLTGMNLEADTRPPGGGSPQNLTLNVIIDGNQIAQLPISHDGQTEHPYAWTPTVGYELQLQLSNPAAFWQLYKVKWIFEVWPDSVARDSFFTDLGYTGSKFMQGMVVPIETGGNPVTFNVNGDCGQQATMGPVTTPANCKMDIAFSFGPCNTTPSAPFIASSIQIVPNNAARIWFDQIKWIWEPEPELVSTWQTQPTDFDLPGWHSLRDCYIAYRGGSGAPTLLVTTEYGTISYPLDYVGPNVYARCYRPLQPQKAKWHSLLVQSCGLFRLYLKDCELRVKAWGSNGPYMSAQPFGDLSRTNGGARI